MLLLWYVSLLFDVRVFDCGGAMCALLLLVLFGLFWFGVCCLLS